MERKFHRTIFHFIKQKLNVAQMRRLRTYVNVRFYHISSINEITFFCLQFFSGTENLELSEYGCVQLALSKQYLIFGSLKDPVKQHTFFMQKRTIKM